MARQDEKERRLRELFDAARTADRAESRSYREVLRLPARKRTGCPVLRLAAVAVAATLTVAVAATWFTLQRRPSQEVAEEISLEPVQEARPQVPPPVPAPELAEIPEPVIEETPPAPEVSETPPVVVAEAQPELPEVSMRDAARQRRWERRNVPAVEEPEPVAEANEPVATPDEPEAVVAPRKRQLTESVVVTGETGIVDLDQIKQVTKYSDQFIQDLPVPGRFSQNVLTIAPGVADEGDGDPGVHGSRSRNYKAVVGGVSNVDPISQPETGPFNTESYDLIRENEFLAVLDNPLSTFSIDVDTASYANVRRYLTGSAWPPRDAVRIEEMVNYFQYDYPAPTGMKPFSASVEIADCPWTAGNRLVRIGLKGREVERTEFNGTNLVFLIDVSGSMQPNNKLPLLKSAFTLLVEQLQGRDRVAIVVYAGASGLVLPSVSGDEKARIQTALGRLDAGGSTNGGSGLFLAYQVARENFIPGGINRVILATDGDFNVGLTDRAALLDLIEKDARKGIFLTALGFGMGNYKDGTLEMLADRGNGNYAYIDTIREARKVLVEEIGGTLVTIAKDVKIQVEFNPEEVGAYRLLGYENRMLKKEDFNDDRRDAGEIGSGHTVTALYEVVPAGAGPALPTVDPLKYLDPARPTRLAGSGEMLTLKLRYKEPDGHRSRLLEFPVRDRGLTLDQASPDFRFAAAVAAFGMVLRDSEHRGGATLHMVRNLALRGAAPDEYGYRTEFLGLVNRAVGLERYRGNE